MPLATRARSEMEELVRCCRHLEERQRRLRQVAPLAEEEDGSAGAMSYCSSVGSAGMWRARSSDAASLAGSQRSSLRQGGQHMPINLHQVKGEELLGYAATSARPKSPGTTPRSTTPRQVTPRATGAYSSPSVAGHARMQGRRPSTQASPRNNMQGQRSCSEASSYRPQSAGSYGRAMRSWVLERDASPHGARARSQERAADAVGVQRSPRETRRTLEGAAGALRDLGLHVPMGGPACVHGVHLTPGSTPRSSSRGGQPSARTEPSRMAPRTGSRSRSKSR